MLRNLLFIAMLAFGFMTTHAQRNCSAMDVLEEQLQKDPKLENKMKEIEKATQNFINNPSKVVNGVITIPVVVHVVYNTSTENISTSQILSQITVLNDDFRRTNSDANGTWSQAADTEIEFCMATVDPNGNATSGITRTSTSTTAFSTNDNMKFNSSGGKDAWPYTDYLNIWVCDISGGILGYAQFPGGSGSTDGVVIDYQYFGTNGTASAPFDLGRTGTHEVGHWLNLRHIWGDGNCNQDDFVTDTPNSDGANYGCASGHVSCSSTDMVENYMDYSDDACMNLYTSGQKTRMRALFEPGQFRSSLLNSTACGSTPPPATCSDGIQNQGETGIDCGGPNCAPCSTACSDNNVNINITFDNYPEETAWTLKNSSGTTVASGGNYGSQPDGSSIVIEECLADGCYDFTITDTYGDGICCSYGNGSYSVTLGSTTLASGGAFGSSEVTNFCLGGGPAPTCNDGIQNGDETGVDCGGSDCVACPTCNDGIQNGDETGVDCGGSCSPCDNGGGCTTVDINFTNFDSGWGIWNDGGSDCVRSTSSAYAYSGTRTARIRDNTNSSTTTTDNLALEGFEEVTIDFTYMARSMENGEDFWLQASLNGGSSYQTVVVWTRGTDFSNDVREFESVTMTGTFTNTTKFRFRCDASSNADYIYLDDIDIYGCVNSNKDSGEDLNIENPEIVELISDVKVYPVPATDLIHLELMSSDDKSIQMVITDTEGKIRDNKELNLVKGNQTISYATDELNSGVYFIQLILPNQKIQTKRIVIIR